MYNLLKRKTLRPKKFLEIIHTVQEDSSLLSNLEAFLYSASSPVGDRVNNFGEIVILRNTNIIHIAHGYSAVDP